MESFKTEWLERNKDFVSQFKHFDIEYLYYNDGTVTNCEEDNYNLKDLNNHLIGGKYKQKNPLGSKSTDTIYELIGYYWSYNNLGYYVRNNDTMSIDSYEDVDKEFIKIYK